MNFSTAWTDTQPEFEAISDELELAFKSDYLAEAWLSNCCKKVEDWLSPSDPFGWLLMARLMEAALLTAGTYADNAEFRAAGDLLVNPRKINVYLKNSSRPIVKHRHGRLSDQFNTNNMAYDDFIRKFPHQAAIKQTEPPLLPYLLEQLERSAFMSKTYLEACALRMNKIADTINFLTAWGIYSFEDLAATMASSDPTALKFIGQHLCRFTTDRFVEIGDEIRQRAGTCGDCENISKIL